MINFIDKLENSITQGAFSMLKIKLLYLRNFLKEKYFNILSSVLGEL